MGDVEAYGMQFRGQAIVSAVLTELQTQRGLAPGARMLFGGCSAGARGVMVHVRAPQTHYDYLLLAGDAQSSYSRIYHAPFARSWTMWRRHCRAWTCAA